MENETVKELWSSGGNIIMDIIKQQREEECKKDKMYFKALTIALIGSFIINVVLGIVIMYKDFLSYNYEGGTIENSYNATDGGSTGASSTINNAYEKPQ